jgi:hypothetical protein
MHGREIAYWHGIDTETTIPRSANGIVRQQSGRGHNLAGLAVAALDDFKIKPCPLNRPACGRIPDASIVVIADVPTLSMLVTQERMGFPSIWTGGEHLLRIGAIA